MKKNFFYLLTAILTLSLCFQGCSKDDDPDLGGKDPGGSSTSVITITTQPASVSVNAGSISGSLSVAASVTPNAALTYQWYSNTSNSNSGGSAVSGATSASFTIPTSLTAGSYYYFCEVKAGSVSARSNAATVTVAAPAAPVITISTQPASASVTAGSITGSLTVAASVTQGGTPTYQWYSNTSNSNSGGSSISGATSASFTIPTSLAAGSHYYFCEVRSSGATSVRSNVATVTVTAPALPAIEVKVNGNISTTNFVEGTTGSVEFNRFPATVNEWKQVREKIGETMMGAFVLQVMASEMYRRNNAIGEECMRLAIISASQNSYINLAKTMKHPYQYAAHLKGASPANGYNPTKPYTIEFIVARTSNKQYSNDYQADVYRFFAISNGHDITERTFSVLKTARPGEPGEGGKYYIVTSSSTLYNECREKSFTVDFNGLD